MYMYTTLVSTCTTSPSQQLPSGRIVGELIAHACVQSLAPPVPDPSTECSRRSPLMKCSLDAIYSKSRQAKEN